MRLQAFVRTIVRCRCGEQTQWCVHVERPAPDPLRCVPGGGGGASGNGIVCTRCGNGAMTVTELERRVADALHGHDAGQWIKAGAVTITC